jgi:aspartokinase-like uncharacterized kinase
MAGLLVVKVGGSLYDLPDLGARLRSRLGKESFARLILVPGGGRTADVVRDLDARQGLGEVSAHWLALRALTFNAHFLAHLLPEVPLLADPALCPPNSVALLDAHAFAQADEGRPGCLPHCWSVTSDSLAARVAVVAQASELVLLKSMSIPPDLPWEEVGRRGLVDPMFADVLRQAPRLRTRAVNLREGS